MPSPALLAARRGFSGGSYAAEVLADNPALYWRLGESSGTNANDETANNRDGTYGSGVTLGQAGAIVGDADTAVDLNDTANGLISSAYACFVNGSQRTFEGWASRDTSTGEDSLFGGTNVTGTPILRCRAGSQDVQFFANRATTSVTWTAAWPGNGQWVHWVLTFNEATDTAELFINGVSKGTQTMASGYSGSAGNFAAGIRGASDPFDGKLDEIAVYESILSGARILAHYDAGT